VGGLGAFEIRSRIQKEDFPTDEPGAASGRNQMIHHEGHEGHEEEKEEK
jgi:hypothetical protein